MDLSDFKADARKHLLRSWSKVIFITLFYFLVIFLINYGVTLLLNESKNIHIIFVILLFFVINMPSLLWYLFSLQRLYSDENMKFLSIFHFTIDNLIMSYMLPLRIVLEMLIPIILYIIFIIVGCINAKFFIWISCYIHNIRCYFIYYDY